MLSQSEKRHLKELTTFEAKMDTTAICKMMEGIYTKQELEDMGNVLLNHKFELLRELNQNTKNMDGRYWLESSKHVGEVSRRCGWRGYTDISKVAIRKLKPVQAIVDEVTKRFEDKLSCKIDLRVIAKTGYNYTQPGAIYSSTYFGFSISGKRMPTLDEVAYKKRLATSWKIKLQAEQTEITTTLATLEKIAPDEE